MSCSPAWPSAARELAKPDATERVARICADVAGMGTGESAEALKDSNMKHAVKHIHFVGIGGAGMSGIAEILHNLGYQVERLRPVEERDDAPPERARHPCRDRP